jgi:hypothetical protein
MSGPHIFDNAVAELDDEVFEGAGLLEIDSSEHNGDPGPVFGIAMSGRNKAGLLVRVGSLPSGDPYLLIEGMAVDTGKQIDVYARPGPGSMFVTTAAH